MRMFCVRFQPARNGEKTIEDVETFIRRQKCEEYYM